MASFLKNIISEIFQSEENASDNVAIIIPNKRAAVYIHAYLSNMKGAALFAPEIVTINEWVDHYTDTRIVSQTELLFLLYEVHQFIEKDAAESFNDFIKWGKIMLSDFDEIDRYLLDADIVFRDLQQIKDIEDWSFDTDELSSGQQEFMRLWDKLPTYYRELNSRLATNNETYQGAAYRDFYTRLTKKDVNILLRNHYYFIGFNALSKSEASIIDVLRKDKKASIYFDVDQFYVDNEAHEAGHFYRKLTKQWKPDNLMGSDFNQIPKHIEIIETAQQIAQTKIAGSVVADIVAEKGDAQETAIVLADESLLIPLMQSLPEAVGKANITMGYPIKFSHLKGLVDIVFEMQVNFQKFNATDIYHKSLLSYLDHPYFQMITGDSERVNQFEYDIIQHNKIFISLDELSAAFPILDGLSMVFKPWENPLENGFQAFNQLVEIVYATLSNQGRAYEIDLEILYHFTKGFQRFEMISKKYPHELNLRSFKQLFYQFWQAESLSFLGNPIKGLQIMGILETRTIDFKNLIILGMNEGNLPKTNVVNSFIPYDLKKHHDLPVEEDRQAIFAHHFYRLLHRAEKVWMTYNSAGEGMSGTEKSRFITQLENEIDPEKGHVLKYSTYASKDEAAGVSVVGYEVSDAAREKLMAYMDKGVSPSALNKLVRCPLDFYYRYVLGMKEGDQVEENIESSTFGTKIHDVLERIFRDAFLDKNKAVDVTTLAEERKKIKSYLWDAYLEDFSKSDMSYGQNKLSFEVSLQFLDRFIQGQIDEVKKAPGPIFMIDLERTIAVDYHWEMGGEIVHVRLEGNADRIDQYGSQYRIIDYKSGKCDKDKVSINQNILGEGQMRIFMDHDKKGYARQLMMYALMFRATFPEYATFTAGIISMVNIDKWIQSLIQNGKAIILSKELLDAFEDELREYLTELYMDGYTFKHNDKSEYCEHCEV